MSHVIHSADLPRFESTRDNRRRVDLVSDEMFGFTDMRADHISYSPGDTAAAHYHVGARHIWFVDSGSGILHVDDEAYPLTKGDVATVAEREVHWFENTGSDVFSF